jgi:hypothetical protein
MRVQIRDVGRAVGLVLFVRIRIKEFKRFAAFIYIILSPGFLIVYLIFCGSVSYVMRRC